MDENQNNDELIVSFSLNNEIFIDVLVFPLRRDEAIGQAKAKLIGVVADVDSLRFGGIRIAPKRGV